MKTRLLIISLVFFGLIGTVHAVPELDPTLAFDYSETVVIGKILSVDILSEPQITRTENYYSEVSGIALYEVEIDEYLKNSSEDNIITVPGLFLREPHAMAYETYPYEIGQQVLLYLQENTHGYADTKLIIRSGDSKVIENGLCDLGYYFDKGQCMKIDDSTKTPDPPCKSVPRPDGEGWVFFDCNWVEIPHGWIFENGIWQEDPNVQRLGPAPLPTCPRDDICTCSGEYNFYSPSEKQCYSSPYPTSEHLESCEKFKEIDFEGWYFREDVCEWIKTDNPYENDESLQLASSKVYGGLGIDPEFGLNTILVGVSVGIGIAVFMILYWRKRK